MTPRERWLTTLNHGVPDRVPCDYRATPEAATKLVAHLGLPDASHLHERLRFDPIVDVGGRYVGPTLPPNEDEFGVAYRRTDYGSGVYNDAVGHPLSQFSSVEEIEAHYTWPEPDWWDYSHIPAAVEGKEDQVIRGGICEEFARYKWLRGVAQAYIDLVDNPEMVHYCLGELYDLCYKSVERIYDQIPGMVIWTWVAEDVGSQEGLLFSLAHIEEYFIPHMKRMIDLVHTGGAYAFHHSDGAVRDNVPNMIDAGIDVLDPVQWRAKGMDRAGLKRDFGDRLTFHGGMDNQHTLAFGSTADVRREVRDCIEILGAGGGYILGPCHNIQAISPPENIVAMYDAAYELGAY